MARKFFYVCAGMLMLAVSYHFGASTATAQAPSNPVVATFSNTVGVYLGGVVTSNGDVYTTSSGYPSGPWIHQSNIFTGGPTQTRQESWGQVKSRYAPTRGNAQPGAQGR